MTMDKDTLAEALPHASAVNLDRFADPLAQACDDHEINTPARLAAFLAQIAVESGSLHYVRELASGEAYEGRKDLGNTEPGDGERFKGRGLIQITGRSNYSVYGAAMGVDLIANPERLEEPDLASISAALFWQRHGLNELADAGDFERITRRINGGLNGYDARQEAWAIAKAAVGVPDDVEA